MASELRQLNLKQFWMSSDKLLVDFGDRSKITTIESETVLQPGMRKRSIF